MKTKNSSVHTSISFGERLATALLSAIVAAVTLFCYFLINLAMASKVPSGPPHWLFELMTSKVSLGLILVASIAGFVLGSSRMAEVFSVLWGTSELWNETWFNRLMAGVAVVTVVVIAAYLLHRNHGLL